MSEKQENTSEEIDLGQLFKLIGDGFKNVFNTISGLFGKIFHFFILILLFFKQHAVKFAIALLIGGFIGYFIDKKEEPIYKSSEVIEINFKAGHNLYNQMEYLNSLIEEGNVAKLKKILNLSEEAVLKLITFEVKPYEKDKNIVLEYDDYLKKTDTIFTLHKGFSITNFKERFSDPDFSKQKITVYALKDFNFSKLDAGISELLENDYFQNLLQIRKKELKRKKETILKDLNQVDSLWSIYKKVQLLAAKNNNPIATNIQLGQKGEEQNIELELFNKRTHLLSKLSKVNREIAHNSFIVKPISKFNTGEKYNKFLEKKWLKFAIFSFLLLLFALLLINLNKYLTAYENKIS